MNAAELATRYAAAIEWAKAAGAITLEYFQGQSLGTEAKRDGSPVTRADRAAEKFLREKISERFPHDGVLGEEFGETIGSSGVRWVLDPIDGTKAFVCGVPLFGVMVGVEWAGEPQIGVVHLPALGETVHAATGRGATWDRSGHIAQSARVSDIEHLKDAVLCITDRALFSRTGTLDRLMDLEARVKLTRGWNDCYAYVLLATGRVDVVVDPVMEVWDIVPLVPIVLEACGMITTWEGAMDAHARRCVATNRRLHTHACHALNGVINPTDRMG